MSIFRMVASYSSKEVSNEEEPVPDMVVFLELDRSESKFSLI